MTPHWFYQGENGSPPGGASKPSPTSSGMTPEQTRASDFGSMQEEEDKRKSPQQDKTNATTSRSDNSKEIPEGKYEQEEMPKPTEKALHGWISAKWKPKGHVTLQLGPKGFFSMIFLCLEDKYRILDEGPYFFNSAGLYLREWVARFNPDKEDLSWAPIWIRMYSLPEEYWDEGLLKDIGNGLGEYIKVAEELKLRNYTSYACICVFMRLDKALPDSVSLFHDDYEWTESLDYEHVPFRCRKCHAHGHLF
eukprot:PITA_03170